MAEFDEGPSEALESATRRFRSRVSQIEGVTNIIRHKAGSNQSVIDFRIGFPFNPLVENQNRLGAVAKSSFTIAESPQLTDGVIIAQATVRLPPVPADVWSVGVATQVTKNSFSRIEDVGMTVHIEPGEARGKDEEWWPHIEFAGLAGGPSLNRVIRWLENSIPGYLNNAREKQKELIKNNG